MQYRSVRGCSCCVRFVTVALMSLLLWQGCAADAVSGVEGKGSAQARIAWLEQRIPAVGPVDPEQLKRLMAELVSSSAQVALPRMAEAGCRAAYVQACALERTGEASFGELEVCGQTPEQICEVEADVWLRRAQDQERGIEAWLAAHSEALVESLATQLEVLGQGRLAERLRELGQLQGRSEFAPLVLTAMQGGSTGGVYLTGVTLLALVVAGVGIFLWARNNAVSVQLAPHTTAAASDSRSASVVTMVGGYDMPEQLESPGTVGGTKTATVDEPIVVEQLKSDLEVFSRMPAVCISVCWLAGGYGEIWTAQGWTVPVGIGAAHTVPAAQTIADTSLYLAITGDVMDESVMTDILHGGAEHWDIMAQQMFDESGCSIRRSCWQGGVAGVGNELPAQIP